jgi:hypothetical protein
LVEYVQTYAPAPTTPNLQAVTNAGASTTNSISAQAFGFYDSSTLSYAALSCDTTGSPSRILIEDSYASPRLSLDTAGTDLTVWANTGSTQAILDFASVSGTKTYTFPNATGTIALTSDLSSYVPYTNATSDIDIGDHNIIAQKSLLGGTISAGFGIFSSYPVVYVNDTSTSSLSALIINNNVGALCLRNSFNIAYLQCTNISSPDKILELPDVTGTLVATIATSAGDLSTGTDGKVTIPDATTSARGLLNSTDWNTFNNKVDGSGTTNYLARWSSGSTIGSSSVIFDDGTRVGIKTATPNTSYDLTINGTTLCTNDVTIDAAKSLYFYKLKFTGNTANNLDYLQMVSQTSNYGASIYLEANGTPSVYGYVWQSRSNTAENGFIIVGCNANPSGAAKDRNAHIISTYANSGTAQGWPLKFRVAKAGQSWNGNTGAEDLIVLTPDQNVGIGTSTPDASAILELNSTTKGFRLPRMGTGGFPASPAKALMVHIDADNDAGRPVGGVFVYDNSEWNNIPYRSYFVYTAIINQSGTNAPTVVATLENNIGTISFSRTNAGVYSISSTSFNGVSSANKVVVFVTNGQSTTGVYRAQYVPPTSAVQLESLNLSGVSADSLINNMNIEIRMYI